MNQTWEMVGERSILEDCEHIAHDPISSASLTLHQELPEEPSCMIVVKPLEVRGTVYLLEQPSAENGNTIKLYLEDLSPGPTVFRFQLYAIT